MKTQAFRMTEKSVSLGISKKKCPLPASKAFSGTKIPRSNKDICNVLPLIKIRKPPSKLTKTKNFYLGCAAANRDQTHPQTVDFLHELKCDLKPLERHGKEPVSGTTLDQTWASLKWEGFEFQTPILTNVVTRDNMAIIKIPHVVDLQKLAASTKNSNLKVLRTDPFFITFPGGSAHVAADVQIFLNGCDSAEGEFVSVFVGLESEIGISKFLPLMCLITIRNKTDPSASETRYFKITQQEDDGLKFGKVTRGLKYLIPIEDFKKFMDNDSNVVLGIGVMKLEEK